MSRVWDTIIIGGGPAGSTAGSLLAKAGYKVLILERESFPRFHAGESLIPYGNDVLRDLGVWEKLEKAGFMPKHGAEFALANGSGLQRFYFGRNLPQGYGQTFQVERAKFDHLLLQHAEERGAAVIERAKVTRLSADESGVSVAYHQAGSDHEARGRWLIDASGRAAVAGNAFGLAKSDLHMPKRLATFGHFTDVFRNDGEEAGHITLVRAEDLWVWFIPLNAEKTSVGLVQTLEDFKGQNRTPEQSFQHAMEHHAELRFRMKNAKRVTPLYSEGEYTFRFDRAAGPRWLLAGDSAGFIDPIFSSGVMVALRSSQQAAEAILRADEGGRPLSRREQIAYTRGVKKMTDAFLHMIRTFYSHHGFEVFMARSSALDIFGAVVNLVGGNTDLPRHLRWRIWAFYGLCRLQKRMNLCPKLRFQDAPPRSSTQQSLEQVSA